MIPKSWLKNTLKVFIVVDRKELKLKSGFEYTFSLKREFISWTKKIQTEVLAKSVIGVSQIPIDERSWSRKRECYVRFWEYKQEIERILGGRDWRAAALDALSSGKIEEKDKFLVEFIESFE